MKRFMLPIVVGAVMVATLSVPAQGSPRFDADETLRRAGVGIYSEKGREAAREDRESARKREDYRKRGGYSAPVIRCRRDLSRPLTEDFVCEEEK